MSAGNHGGFLFFDASTDPDDTRACNGRNSDILSSPSFSSEPHQGLVLSHFAGLSDIHSPTEYFTATLPGPNHRRATQYYDNMTQPVRGTTPCYVPFHCASGSPETAMLGHNLPQQHNGAPPFVQPATDPLQPLEYDPLEGQRWFDQRGNWNWAPRYYQPTVDHLVALPLPLPLPGPIRRVPQSDLSDQHVSYAAASGETYTILQQELYQTGIPTTKLHPPVKFHSFNLLRAYNQETQDLAESKEPALGRDYQLAQKMAVVFLFPGCPKYSRQVYVFRSGTHPVPHTRAQLATVIAKEMYLFIHKALKAGQPLQSQEGEILALEDLVLVDVRHVSQGSLQPTIGLIQRPRTAGS